LPRTLKDKIECPNCGKEYVETNYYNSISVLFSKTKKIPYCKQCIKKFYDHFVERYTNEGCEDPEKKAVRRICMAFDINFNAKAYEECVRDAKTRKMDISPFSAYMKRAQLLPHKNRTYDDTISDEEETKFVLVESGSMDDEEQPEIDIDTKNFFGYGFNDEDYRFLKKEYDDWTARHECKTKAQEEVFKDICFNRLQNLKALRAGEDTKDITASFQKLLDSGKLQPKQNAGDTTADNQTFGTLIDKCENERPLPDIDEELKDVDKIGWYIDVFFRGHLSKMMGLKNGLSNLYTKFIKQYTVEKPEYTDEENSEVLFDAIFGNPPSNSESDKVVVD
jgi:hypothetical protein